MLTCVAAAVRADTPPLTHVAAVDQVLSLLEQEKSGLLERLGSVQTELTTAHSEYERLRREGQARSEQDRNVIINLNAETKNWRAQCEEAE